MTSPIFASPTDRRAARPAWPLGYWFALSCALLITPVRAAADGAARSSNPLPELPAIPSVEEPRPAPADLEELDTRLTKLCSEDEDEGVRDAARREALEVDAKLVPAIRFRLAALSERENHDDLKELLLRLRKKGRADSRDDADESAKHGKTRTPDYLQMVAEHAEPHSKLWCSLVTVLAESRMLAQIGTVEAVRGVIDVYVRYGEFLRVDTQLQLEALGDRAVAALIETRRHPAEKVAKWAERELDTLGKAIPSETVQTNDLQVLADVLRAYGRVRDPDAARIVVSFANSERAQIREASRQAIAMFGEVGAWQLRDTYEEVVGKKPPRDWNWERTARELFGEFDRLRSAEVSTLYDAGVAAHEHGDLEAMRTAFDQVLTRSPDYPKQADLAAAYLEYAQKNPNQNTPNVLSALRRAERLGKGSEAEKTAISLRLTLEAETLADAGIPDRTLLSRALETDPKNGRAHSELSRFQHGEIQSDDSSRYLAAGAIGFVALAGIAFVLLRRPPPEDGGGGGKGPSTKPEAGTPRDASGNGFNGESNVTRAIDALNDRVPNAQSDADEKHAGTAVAEIGATAASEAELAATRVAPDGREPQKAEEPTSPIGEASSQASDREKKVS